MNHFNTLPLVERVKIQPASRDGSQPAGTATITIQYDSGADRSILDSRVVEKYPNFFKTRGQLDNTQVYFADGTAGPADPELMEVAIKPPGQQPDINLTAMVLPEILELPSISTAVPAQWRKELGSTVAVSGPVDLIIGQDNPQLQPQRRSTGDEPTGRLCIFTSTITGKTMLSGSVKQLCNHSNQSRICRTMVDHSINELDKQLQAQWANENAALLAQNPNFDKDHNSRVASYESNQLYQGLVFNENLGKWDCTYIYNMDLLKDLKPNYPIVEG